MVAEGLELFFKFTQALEKISLRLTGVLEKSSFTTMGQKCGTIESQVFDVKSTGFRERDQRPVGVLEHVF